MVVWTRLPMTVREFPQAERLCRHNMQPYYRRYQLVWNSVQFRQQLAGCENYFIMVNDQQAGFMSLDRRYLSDTSGILTIRDLQLEPAYQGRGIGGQALNWIQQQAWQGGVQSLRIAAFVDNPALALYQRYGFEPVKQENCIVFLQMENPGKCA